MNNNIVLYLILNEDNIRSTISRAYTSIESCLYYKNSSLSGLLAEKVLEMNDESGFKHKKSLENLQLLQDDLENQTKIVYSSLTEEDILLLKDLNIKDILKKNVVHKQKGKNLRKTKRNKVKNNRINDIMRVNFDMLNEAYNRQNIYELFINETKLYLYKEILDCLYADEDFRVRGRVINSVSPLNANFEHSEAYGLLLKHKIKEKCIGLYVLLFNNFFVNYVNELDKESDFMVFLEHKHHDDFDQINCSNRKNEDGEEFDINRISQLDDQYTAHLDVNDDFRNSAFCFDPVNDVNRLIRKSKIKKQLSIKEYLSTSLKYDLLNKISVHEKESAEEIMISNKELNEEVTKNEIYENDKFKQYKNSIKNTSSNYLYSEYMHSEDRNNALHNGANPLMLYEDKSFTVRANCIGPLIKLMNKEIVKGIKMFVNFKG